MKKRAIRSLLAAILVMSFILPALAIETGGNEELAAETGAVIPAETDSAIPAETGAVIPAEPGAAVPTEPFAMVLAEADEAVSAEPEPEGFIYLDGVPQTVEYELWDGTTYVTVSSFIAMVEPQAAVEEADGVVTASSARVRRVLDAEGNPANVVQESFSMTVSAHVPYIVVNGRYLYAKDSIITVNGHVAAPIRKLAMMFNLDVDYDGAAHAVLLTHVQGRSIYIRPGDSYYDADALFWMSRIIHAESGDQTLEGKIAVGNVVMNRVRSPEFPNTLYDVLNQQNQFVPTGVISQMSPNSESVVAAKLVMEGAVVMPTALFFNMKGLPSYAASYRPYITTIGDHDFFN